MSPRRPPSASGSACAPTPRPARGSSRRVRDDGRRSAGQALGAASAAAADATAERLARACDSQRHPAIRAAQHLAALVAAQRGGAARDHERHASAATARFLDGPGEGRVRGWLRRMPRVSAATTSGQSCSGAGASASWKAPVGRSARSRRQARRRENQPAALAPGPLHQELARVKPRGAGGLCAVSASSSSASVAGGSRGRAGRSACPPRRAAGRARAEPGRPARRIGGATVQARAVEPLGPAGGGVDVGGDHQHGAVRARGQLRQPRVSPEVGPELGWQGAAPGGHRRRRHALHRRAARGGGSSAARVEPGAERLSAAAQRPSSSITGESTGAGSSALATAASPEASASRSASTRPTRARPCTGAVTRWPGASASPSGTA